MRPTKTTGQDAAFEYHRPPYNPRPGISREAFQATLRGWGMNDDSTLVIYDDSRTALAARLYFLLDLYGFDMKQVKILNGGTVD